MPCPQPGHAVVPTLNIIRQNLCAMNDRENVNPLVFDPVNDPVGFFDDLADVFRLVFRHHSAGEWMIGDLFGTAGDPIHHP